MTGFRTATFRDARAIARLVNSGYRGEYSKQGWTTEADLIGGQRTNVSEIKKIIRSPHSQMELYYEGNQLLACVNFTREKDSLYVGMLTVEPMAQGKGLGKNILQHAEKTAGESGLSKLRMTVIDQRAELIAFYARRGFVPTGNWIPFPEDDPTFGLPKVRGMKLMEFVRDISGPR